MITPVDGGEDVGQMTSEVGVQRGGWCWYFPEFWGRSSLRYASVIPIMALHGRRNA